MPTFLDETQAEIDRRLKELRPLVDEYHALERAQAALEKVNGKPAPQRRTSKPRARRRGGTTEAAVAFIRANPGATTSQIAKGIGLKHPNYLYRVLPTLQQQGTVKKDGKGWTAA